MKRAGFITKVLVFAVIAFLAWKILDLRGDISGAKSKQEQLRAQAAALEIENDEMRRRIAGADTDEIIEEMARDAGYVMPGEEVIYN